MRGWEWRWMLGGLMAVAASVWSVGSLAADVPEKTQETLLGQERQIARTRAAFDEGFAMLSAKLATRADAQTPAMAPLADVLAFRAGQVGWARLEGSDYMAYLSKGKPKGWNVVVPPGHPKLQDMDSSLTMIVDGDLFVVLIEPVDFDPIWAGVFGVHENSHLRDRAEGIEPLSPSHEEFMRGEYRAYRAEMLAADVMTDGRAARAIDAVIAGRAPADFAEVAGWSTTLTPEEMARIDLAFGGAAESKEEGELRGGFYALGLMIRYADAHGLGERPVIDALDRLMHPDNAPQTDKTNKKS